MGGVRDASSRGGRRHILLTGQLVFGETPTSRTTSRPLLSNREAVSECEGKGNRGKINPRPAIVSKSLSRWQWSIFELPRETPLKARSPGFSGPGARETRGLPLPDDGRDSQELRRILITQKSLSATGDPRLLAKH